MFGEKHDLVHEFPEYEDRIQELKMSDSRFAELYDEYHKVNDEVWRIEEGIENTDDFYLEELKKRRLHYKDELYAILVK
jgi:uncharacterized protein YdcH (DUF465 family)